LTKKADIIDLKIDIMRQKIGKTIKKVFTQSENKLSQKLNNIENCVEEEYYSKLFKDQMLFLRQPIKTSQNNTTNANDLKKSVTPKNTIEKNTTEKIRIEKKDRNLHKEIKQRQRNSTKNKKEVSKKTHKRNGSL